MPGAATHSYLTESALKLVPGFPGEHSAFINDYCNYPDHYFGGFEKIKPYYFETDGIQFHYPPDIPYNDLYRYWGMNGNRFGRIRQFRNENFVHVHAGFAWYLERTVNCFKHGDWEEGKKYLGSLLHMLQDSTFGAHVLEGAGGTDLFALNRLIESEELPVMALINISCLEFHPPEYVPVSLGSTADEAVMNLYTEYCCRTDRARKCAFRIILNEVYGKKADSEPLVKELYENSVALCSDVIFTVLEIARGVSEIRGDLPLHLIEPFEFPLGGFGNYVFRTIEKDRAFLKDGTAIPLEIRTGQDRRSVKGFSFGVQFEGALRYWIAPGAFREFCGCIGLHPAYGGRAKIFFEILNNGIVAESFEIDDENPVHEIHLTNPCNEVAIQFRTDFPYGILVLGDAILKR